MIAKNTAVWEEEADISNDYLQKWIQDQLEIHMGKNKKGLLLLFLTTFKSKCSLSKHFCFYVNIIFPSCRLLKKKLDFGETLVLG